MGFLTFVSIPLLVLMCNSIASEKVLSIGTTGTSAEGKKVNGTVSAEDVKPKSGVRSSRFLPFSDASQQQDFRIPQLNHHMFSLYNPTQVEDEDGRLNFLHFMGHDGMQVGQDFKPPSLSAPHTEKFSALLSPLLRLILGSSNSPYGSTISALSSLFNLDSNDRFPNGIVTSAVLATVAYLYPKVSKLFSLTPSAELDFRQGRGSDKFFQSLNSVMGHFDIDGAACMKVAFCSLGKGRKQERSIAKEPSEETTYADVLVDVMNLPSVKKFLKKRGFIQAKNFGESGGDCENFNSNKKCPIGIETFRKYFSSLK